MSLTDRERRCLDDFAQEFRRDDPLLAHMLTRGRWLPRRTRLWVSAAAFVRTRRWWQYLLMAVAVCGLITLMVAVLGAHPVAFIVGASVMVGASAAVCVISVVRRRRGLRADDWRIAGFDTMGG